MNLATVFPPFGLRIEAGPLVLRPITDDVLPDLVDLALGGIHDPEMMPFNVPWTDAPPGRLPLNFTLYHWGQRASWSLSTGTSSSPLSTRDASSGARASPPTTTR